MLFYSSKILPIYWTRHRSSKCYYVAHDVLSQMPVRKKEVFWELADYLADEKDVIFRHLLDRVLVLSVLTRKSHCKNFLEGSMLNARIRICSLTDAPLVAQAFRLVIWKKAIVAKSWQKNLRKHLGTGSQCTELFKWLQFQPFFYVQYELSERWLTVIQDYKQIKGFNFSRITVFSWGLTSGQSQHARTENVITEWRN